MSNDLTSPRDTGCVTVFMKDTLLMNKEYIHDLYWEKKMSHREIARLFGCSQSWVHTHAKELGIDGVITSSRQIGKKNHKYVTADEKIYRYYRWIRDEGRMVPEHRVVAANALGRKLKNGEMVHHINGNKLDNRNKNLLICSFQYHRWLHNRLAQLYMNEHFGGQHGK